MIAAVVSDQSEFIYEADITSVGGEDPDPGDDDMDEVVIGICNPGTSGAGGASGVSRQRGALATPKENLTDLLRRSC